MIDLGQKLHNQMTPLCIHTNTNTEVFISNTSMTAQKAHIGSAKMVFERMLTLAGWRQASNHLQIPGSKINTHINKHTNKTRKADYWPQNNSWDFAASGFCLGSLLANAAITVSTVCQLLKIPLVYFHEIWKICTLPLLGSIHKWH